MRKTAAPIDPHEYDTLNREFYSADPAEVIQQRLWMLARFVADDSDTISSSSEQLSMGRDTPLLTERIQFAALESTLIRHQAAETLLRLYFAHENAASCPWSELTTMRAPGVLGKKVRVLRDGLESDRVIRDVLEVVSWSGDRKIIEDGVTWNEKGGWSRHLEGLRLLFRFACDTVLDGADLYNAGKHGLAVVPQHREMKLNEGELISVDGPSLTVIEPHQHNGEPRWVKVTHWVNYQREIMMTHHLSSAIRSLWACGKQRRTGNGELRHIQIFNFEELENALKIGTASGFNVSTMSELLFDLEHPMWTNTPPEQQM